MAKQAWLISQSSCLQDKRSGGYLELLSEFCICWTSQPRLDIRQSTKHQRPGSIENTELALRRCRPPSCRWEKGTANTGHRCLSSDGYGELRVSQNPPGDGTHSSTRCHCATNQIRGSAHILVVERAQMLVAVDQPQDALVPISELVLLPVQGTLGRDDTQSVFPFSVLRQNPCRAATASKVTMMVRMLWTMSLGSRATVKMAWSSTQVGPSKSTSPS